MPLIHRKAGQTVSKNACCIPGSSSSSVMLRDSVISSFLHATFIFHALVVDHVSKRGNPRVSTTPDLLDKVLSVLRGHLRRIVLVPVPKLPNGLVVFRVWFAPWMAFAIRARNGPIEHPSRFRGETGYVPY